MIQAAILAGGKGQRLAARLAGKPKPLIDLCGKPLLQHQVETLREQGVDRFLVLVNYAAEQIREFFAKNGDFGCVVEIIDDGVALGTAGAVLQSLDHFEDRFITVYGDTLFNIDIAAMLAYHRRSAADATLFLHPNDHPHDSDLVELDQADRIVAFHGYPHPTGALLPNQVNAAFYILERDALEPWKGVNGPLDFAKDLFPRMLADGVHFAGYRSFEYIKDCGTPARLDQAERHLAAGVVEGRRLSRPQACVFIDRDGTLNKHVGYVRSPEELWLLPGVGPAVRRLNENEFRTVVVTNQPVLARGDVDEAGLERIHRKLESNLGDYGAYLDRIYYCPHHPDKGFLGENLGLKIACDCRKPMIGMFARSDVPVDKARSWMIGDSSADMLAAERFGIRSILVMSGEGGLDGKHAFDPDFVVEDFAAAVQMIIEIYPRLVEYLSPLISCVRAGDLILIGGLARSGKSTIAACLFHELIRSGLSAASIPIDRWIRPSADRLPGVLGRYDLADAVRMLEPWLDGGDVDTVAPIYERGRRDRREGGRSTIVARDDVLIVEGGPALMTEWPTGRRTHRLFLSADETMRSERVVSDLLRRFGGPAADARAIHDERLIDEVPAVLESARTADRYIRLDDILSPLSRHAQ